LRAKSRIAELGTHTLFSLHGITNLLDTQLSLAQPHIIAQPQRPTICYSPCHLTRACKEHHRRRGLSAVNLVSF